MTFFYILLGAAVVLVIISAIYCRRITKIERMTDNKYQRTLKELKELKEKTNKDLLDTEKTKTFENRISDLNVRIVEKEEEIKRCNTVIQEFEDKIYKITLAYNMINPMLARSREEFDKLNEAKLNTLAAQKTLDEALLASKTAAQVCEKDIEILKNELEDLKTQKRLAILNQKSLKEGLLEFSINDKERELISILERIKLDYPDLKIDISSIE